MVKYQLIDILPSMYHMCIMTIISQLMLNCRIEWYQKVFFDQSRKSKYTVVAAVRKRISKLILPTQLKPDLVEMAEKMADNLVQWVIDMVRDVPEVHVSTFIDYVKFNSIGVVDTSRTLRDWYFARRHMADWGLFRVLSRFSLGDCIADYMPSLMEEIGCFPILRSLTDYPEATRKMTIYWWFTLQKDKSAFKRYCQDFFPAAYDQDASVEFNMFVFSINEGSYWSAKYFWSQMDEGTRIKAIDKIKGRIMAAVFKSPRANIEMFLWLWMQMSARHVDFDVPAMLNNNRLRLAVTKWPWREMVDNTMRTAMVDFQDNDCLTVGVDYLVTLGIRMQRKDDDLACHQLFDQFWAMWNDQVISAFNWKKLICELLEEECFILLHKLLDELLSDEQRVAVMLQLVTYPRFYVVRHYVAMHRWMQELNDI
uniref:Uncharacterized protein n=1 Tax=Bracon brevicornis TaxID=1563983 RepID=A0A6V7K7G7_9HYME